MYLSIGEILMSHKDFTAIAIGIPPYRSEDAKERWISADLGVYLSNHLYI
jgi:hypothetical protein